MTSHPSEPVSSPQPDLSAQQFSAAAERNLASIQSVLGKYLPDTGRVLEIASGTGQHIVSHASVFPHLMWLPTDLDPERRASIEAYRRASGLQNVLPPIALDACARGWARRRGPVEAIVVVNLLHLITDADMAVLLDEATQSLTQGGVLAIYGPFLREGQTTSPGDATFHADLIALEEGLGYKDLGVVASVLEALSMRVTTHPMPANNIMIVARKP